MKQLTGVEWLVKELELDVFATDEEMATIIKAKEMEKKKIIDAVYYNTSATRHDDLPKGEQYYKDTFK
jgi:hypothetical protein